MTYRSLALSAAALLLLAGSAYAQHDHGSMTGDPPMPPFNATGDEPMSYALFPDNKGYFYTHVTLMVLAFWVLMPMGKQKIPG